LNVIFNLPDIEWIHSENVENADVAAGEKALSGWNVVNFRGGWNCKMLTLNVGVENIFDRRYAVANSYEWDVVSGFGQRRPEAVMHS